MDTTLQKTERSKKRSSSRTKSCGGPQDLSRLELKCMKAVWLQKAETVLEVQQALTPQRSLAYTTILTIMDRLSQKGAVTRHRKGRAYVYRAGLSFADSRKMALKELVDFYFEGSVENLIHYLTNEGEVSESGSRVPNVQKGLASTSPEIVDALL